MGGAPVVLVLAGMLIPIAFLLFAVVFDAAFMLWMLYRYVREEWSVSAPPAERPVRPAHQH